MCIMNIISVKIYKALDFFLVASYLLYTAHSCSICILIVFQLSSGKQLQILIEILNYIIMTVYK